MTTRRQFSKIVKELSHSTGVPQEQIQLVLDELGLKELKERDVKPQQLQLKKLKLAFRIAAICVSR